MTDKREKSIEFHDDAMERFERAVKAVAKSPPQHRAPKKTKGAPTKRRVQKVKK
ncbi:hypothetical protein [Bradyrhizobium viridifuturi]|uniref:hypothetical protein n=1 Tax=Bradyrhizobium viridifuturi TaxID=1654716 RepID=UPI000B2C0B46|nr:hypothetical protein [Bradyrhizobium viridifuturi]